MFEQDKVLKEIVTTNEVVDLLGVSKQTIYNYVKSGKLKLVYDDWQIDGTMKFYLDEINQLRPQTEKPEGLTVLEMSNMIGVSKATIHQYIRAGKISSKKEYYKGRNTIFIPNDEANKLKTTIKNAVNKKSFFTKDLQYFLFGLYVIPHSNEKEIWVNY